MRIWDVSPGYLSRESLLGEHRELHGLYSILIHEKRGYSRHPETLRWVGCLSGLVQRHAQLVAEMDLRGYVDRTPLRGRTEIVWPAAYIDVPGEQFGMLAAKYQGRTPGRIPLPRSPQDLWAHHKYSVMARDPSLYREIGRRVARFTRGAPLDGLAADLVLVLRLQPAGNRLLNALEHMWGHVAPHATASMKQRAASSPRRLLAATRRLAEENREPYLMSSTALSELAVFVRRAG